MKKLFLLSFLFISILAFGQEKGFTLKELDSLTSTAMSDNRKTMMTSGDDFEVIEKVPIYKGCGKFDSNQEKKKCMSLKISDLFLKNFNTVIHEDSNLEANKARILVSFKISTKGDIIDISAKAPDKYLEAEAIRVVKMIPKLKPGLQRGKNSYCTFLASHFS